MMMRRNDERDNHHSSSRHNRQETQHITSKRTQHLSPSRHNMDRYSSPIDHLRSGDYGTVLDFFHNLFSQLNVRKRDT
jgi:hypothetical protein